MKDYNHKDHYHGSHLEGMEAKHARKIGGAFYHNVMERNLLKDGHSSKAASKAVSTKMKTTY